MDCAFTQHKCVEGKAESESDHCQVALGWQTETRCLEISLELNGFPWLNGCLLPRTPVLSLDQCPPQEFLARMIDQKMLLTRGDKRTQAARESLTLSELSA